MKLLLSAANFNGSFLLNNSFRAVALSALLSIAPVTAQENKPKLPIDFPPSNHAPALRFGIGTHLARTNNGWSPDMMPMIRSLGVGSIRDEDNWSGVETQKGVYQANKEIESAINKGNALNLQTLFMLAFGNTLYANRTDAEAFTRYALWMIEHYKGRVKYFEVWSEPELHDFLEVYGGTWNGKEADNSDSAWVKKFAEFATYVTREIKRKHPELMLVGYSANPPATIRHFKYPEMWKYLDVLAVHPYPYNVPPESLLWGGPEINARDGVVVADDDHSFTSFVRRLREGLKEVGRANMPIWITEVGYSTAQVKRTGLWQGFTEYAQAAYTVRLGIQAAGNGIDRTFFYDFYDDGPNRHEIEDNFGLVRRDYSLKPSFHALQRLCALMPGDTKSTPLNLTVERLSPWRADDKPQTYAFRRPDGTTVLFLWQAGRIYADAQEELVNLTISTPTTGIAEAGRVVSGDKISPVAARKDNSLVLSDVPLGADPVYIVMN